MPVSVAVEDAEGSEIETLALAEANISAAQGPTRVVLRFTPKQAGEMRIAVKVAPARTRRSPTTTWSAARSR